MSMKLSYIYVKVLRQLKGKAIRSSIVHSTAKVNTGCNIVNSSFGRYSYCGYDCQMVNTGIGAFCSIGDRVYIGAAEHPMEWVSMSPVFENTKHSGPSKRFAQINLPPAKRTEIGSDVWIGYGAVIKQGGCIGHGAVVGSGAVVTKDVPPYAIVGGVPAKIIKYRFDEETMASLLESKWWEMDDDELQKYAHLIQSPRDFLTAVKDCLSANRVGYKWLIYSILCYNGAPFVAYGQRRVAA